LKRCVSLFQLFLHQTLALVCASTSAFAPQPSAFVSKELSASAPVIDNLGSNLAVKNLLLNVESSAGLLTKVVKSGLISKAQEASISLSKLEPLLQLAAGPEILPLLPTLFDLAPPVFPILTLLPFRFQRQLLEPLVWHRHQRPLLLLVSFQIAGDTVMEVVAQLVLVLSVLGRLAVLAVMRPWWHQRSLENLPSSK
jgi:hypothetical protein